MVAAAQDSIHVHNFYGQNGKNVIIFGLDNGLSVYIDGKNKNILVFVKDQHKA